MRTYTGGVLGRDHHAWQHRNRQEFPMLIGVAVLALATRLAVAVLTSSWVFPSYWNFWEFGYEMGQIGASIAMGNGFSWPEWSSYPHGPTSWIPPIYPFIIAGVFKSLGVYSIESALVLEFFQIVISSVTCVVLYFLGKRLYNAQVGLLAACLLAIYPPAIYYAVRIIWGTTLFTCCLLLVILMFLKQADHPHVKGGIGLGALMGFTVLVEPIVISVYPFALAWLFLKALGEWRIVTKTIASALIVFCLAISPWIGRNYFTFGRFIFIKSNLGTVLFSGNNEYATGTYKDGRGPYRDHEKRVRFTEAEQEYLKRSDELTRNRFLKQKAISFIAEHPLRFVQRTINRFITFWTLMRPVEGWQAMISLLAYLTVLILAVAGLFLSRIKRRDVQLVLIFLLFLPITYYFTVAWNFRFRFPIEPLLIVFAGYAMCRIACRYKKPPSRLLPTFMRKCSEQNN